MGIFTMIIWVLIAPISLVLARGVLIPKISAGPPALAGVGGAGLMILYVILDAQPVLAWVAAGLAILGLVAVTTTSVILTSADGREITRAHQAVAESSAGFAGLLLTLFPVVALLSIATALD